MANGSLLMDYAAGGWIEDIEVRNPGQHSHGIDGPLMVYLGLPIKKGDFPWLC